MTAAGPLAGIRIVEIAGIGPGPWCAMVLSDLGAEVLRVDRPDRVGGTARDTPEFANLRGRRSAAVDLKHPHGAEVVLRLVDRADGLLEGFRPGVAERLGIGPERCLARNPRLVYGRLTGWGQEGPLARSAGHDINYLALTGLLDAIGPPERPVPPLNLVGDYGGGGLLLAFGMVCGLLEAARSGVGQVVDAAMVDGASLLGSMYYVLRQIGVHRPQRASNLLDGGAPFYDTYETAGGGRVAVGAIEPQFYAALLAGLELDPDALPAQNDQAAWPQLRARFAAVFRTRTRAEWLQRFADTDACVSAVLTLDEALDDDHATARGAFVEVDELRHVAPAPRFSRTPGAVQRGPCDPGEHTEPALRDWGFSAAEISRLRAGGAIA